MTLAFANTFPPSAARLRTYGDRIWDFVNKFQRDPSNPGISLERIPKHPDANIWSARITQDLRAILHQDGPTYTLLYVDHHDDAYDWAFRRRLERHVRTGALQIVEVPELVEEAVPLMARAHSPEALRRLFDDRSDDYLISLGSPPSWLPAIRELRDEDELLSLADHLPEEVAERLLTLATGDFVPPPPPLAPEQSTFESEDTRRRFTIVSSDAEVMRLLDAPLTRWIAFLHPSQHRLAYGSFNGPLKITGSAGTGKTVAALHRARHLSRQGDRVLVTSFVKTLCHNIDRNLRLLCDADELSRINVSTVHAVALSTLGRARRGRKPIGDREISQYIASLSTEIALPVTVERAVQEWSALVSPLGITSWDEYRSASRIGRGWPLSVRDRHALWQAYEKLIEMLDRRSEGDWPTICRLARQAIVAGEVQGLYDSVIVDEAQDLGPQELQLLAAIASRGHLTLVGDGGQRIYPGRASLRALGIDVRGRSHRLRVNYRTTEQIRRYADRLNADVADDLDGESESRKGTISLLSGPMPTVVPCETIDAQAGYLASQIAGLLNGSDGLLPEEIAVFTRRADDLDTIERKLNAAGLTTFRISADDAVSPSAVNLGTMHRAKGLEYKIVFVANVSADVLPPKHVRDMDDVVAKEEAMTAERQLLYVSITRARDQVTISYVGEASPFLSAAETQ